jgi:hypothetical protein
VRVPLPALPLLRMLPGLHRLPVLRLQQPGLQVLGAWPRAGRGGVVSAAQAPAAALATPGQWFVFLAALALSAPLFAVLAAWVLWQTTREPT